VGNFSPVLEFPQIAVDARFEKTMEARLANYAELRPMIAALSEAGTPNARYGGSRHTWSIYCG
jgi:hypothetical protein